MSSINCLVPGHVQQPFSYFRSALYDNAKKYAEVKGKTSPQAITVIGSVALLSKVSEFIELPFKIIEDVALTIINLIGAIFNKECRGHLKECGWQLL